MRVAIISRSPVRFWKSAKGPHRKDVVRRLATVLASSASNESGAQSPPSGHLSRATRKINDSSHPDLRAVPHSPALLTGLRSAEGRLDAGATRGRDRLDHKRTESRLRLPRRRDANG